MEVNILTLDINEQEKELLLEVLTAAHSSLLDELLHTSSFEYRGFLHEKDDLLKNLKSKVEALNFDGKKT
jgi:hypothetical protein